MVLSTTRAKKHGNHKKCGRRFDHSLPRPFQLYSSSAIPFQSSSSRLFHRNSTKNLNHHHYSSRIIPPKQQSATSTQNSYSLLALRKTLRSRRLQCLIKDCWFEGLRSGPEVKEAPLRVGELLRPVLQEDAVVLVEEL